MKKLILTLAVAALFVCVFAISAFAATYYVDYDGNLVGADSENIAYEYEFSGNKVQFVYLYDENIRKIVIPDMPDVTATIQVQRDWNKPTGYYLLEDKATKLNDLMALIEVIEIHENVKFDGAGSFGDGFTDMASLRELHIYKNVTNGSLSFKNTSLQEVHFYGQNINPSSFISQLSMANMTIVFHSDSTATLNTGEGVHTIPTFSNLNNWKLIINPNVLPSNPDDPRLGSNWGSVGTTNGWELVVAIDSYDDYDSNELEALTTSHKFTSRFNSLELSSTKVASVQTYCELGYNSHESAKNIIMDSALSFLAEIKVQNLCGKCLSVSDTVTIDPIFTCLGYSSPEKNKGGLVIDFTVDKDAVALYESITGNTIKYGMFAVAKNALGINNVFDENGNLTSGGTKAEISDRSYAGITLKITGFETEAQKSAMLAIGAYVSVTDSNNETKHFYIQEGAPLEGDRYSFISYDTII